jgi:DNA-binding protein YbaB
MLNQSHLPQLNLPPLPADAEAPLREAHALMTGLMGVLGGLSDARYEGEAANGHITATVDGNGALLSMYIHPAALRGIRASELGPLALEAIQQARLAMMAAFQGAVGAVTGTGVPDVSTLSVSDKLGPAF